MSESHEPYITGRKKVYMVKITMNDDNVDIHKQIYDTVLTLAYTFEGSVKVAIEVTYEET